MSAIPAWLWVPDATRVLWANASGAAALGAATPAALTELIFQADEPVAADVVRLAGSLPQSGAPRLERVRGIGSNLVCTCSRVPLPEEMQGILVVASEPARPVLPLAERAARLFGASNEALAVFSTAGALLYATGNLEPDTTLKMLGAEALRADSLAKTPHGLLSRGAAGVLGATLVVNLPGSTGGCRDGFAVLRPALAHALELLADAPTAHEQT